MAKKVILCRCEDVTLADKPPSAMQPFTTRPPLSPTPLRLFAAAKPDDEP